MSTKRRDNRNRILRNGEGQRSNGLYYFKFSDKTGKKSFVYSWKLEPTDRLPAGKKEDFSLREKERQIELDLLDSIIPFGGNYTVLQLVKRYVFQKTGVRNNTRTGYKTVLNWLDQDPFGSVRIDCVKPSDARSWLIYLQKEKGKSYSSIHSIRGVVRPAFKMAVEDDLIKRNPFDFELATVVVNDSIRREALTRDQERKLLEFIKNDRHFSRYYEGIFILFKTGMRISEFVGLTLDNVDMVNRRITIDHQLQRSNDMRYTIVAPKTGAGTRVIPMGEEVYSCFEKILAQRKPPQNEPVIDGHSGFLYYDKEQRPMVALHWEKYLKHIVEKYNKIYKEEMPKVTPHVCRHTYCSIMAKSGMNPKTLQYLMGHSDIGVTLNTYTHINYIDAENEVKRLEKDRL